MHKVSQAEHDQNSDKTDEEILALFCTKSRSFTEPMTVIVQANQADLTMEVDTGTSVSLISEATYKQLGKVIYPS